jgi:hypothetical protein
MSSIQAYVYGFLQSVGFREEVLGGKTLSVIKLTDIEKWCRSNSAYASSFFVAFPHVVFNENLEEGYFDKGSHQNKQKLSTTVLTVIVGVISFIMFTSIDNAMPVLTSFLLTLAFALAIIAFLIAMFFSTHGEKRTEKGHQEAEKWLGLKSYF